MPNSDQTTLQTHPRFQLRDLISGYFVSRANYMAARLDIATLLAHGPKTCPELADMTHTHADTLYRLLRALASYGVFTEDDQGRFSNTDKSELLRSDIGGSMRPFALFYGDDMVETPWQSLLHSVTTGEAAFEHVYGVNQFQYLSTRPDKAKIFDEAMVSISGMMNTAIAEAYDFSSFGTMVDIAGGYGSTLCTISKKNPALRGMLFDMPHVIDGARQYITEQGVADRCTIISGDFLQAVPEGADAYFMKHIIHDWDDERCIKILRNCHQAMPSNGKLLVCERVVPIGNTPSYSKLIDLQMLALTEGGWERTEAQYRTLFKTGGFRLTRIVATESENSVMEGQKL